jgi:hypothetical protein
MPFHLISDAPILPSALNAHRTRASFDSDFVANLLSRSNHTKIVDVILDTGCTFSITPDRNDFVQYTSGSFGQVQTVNGPTDNIGFGFVRWILISENGQHITLNLPCHHVPSAKTRLLSPQDFCQAQGLDRSKDQYAGNSGYFWMHADHAGTRFQCPIDPRTNLPVAHAKIPCKDTQCHVPTSLTPCPSCSGLASLSVTDETNQNITPAQKELLHGIGALDTLGSSIFNA